MGREEVIAMIRDERYSEAFEAYGKEPDAWRREVADRIPDGPVLTRALARGSEGHEASRFR